jgi:glycerol-3-phosphate dehydrogenase
VSDVIFRRTSLAFTGDADAAAVSAIARELAALLEWADDRIADEIAQCLQTLRDAHGVDVDAARAAAR